MIIYRAMCTEEFSRTVASGKPDFSKSRFKWFSPSLEFIKTRVRDGKFNNSRHCPDRYVKLLAFEYQGTNLPIEVQVDRRKNLMIKLLGEIHV